MAGLYDQMDGLVAGLRQCGKDVWADRVNDAVQAGATGSEISDGSPVASAANG